MQLRSYVNLNQLWLPSLLRRAYRHSAFSKNISVEASSSCIYNVGKNRVGSSQMGTKLFQTFNSDMNFIFEIFDNELHGLASFNRSLLKHVRGNHEVNKS